MRMIVVILMLVLCLPGVARAADNKLPPVNFDQDTLSLPPAYFPELPGAIRAWLEQREYRIPQVHEMYIEQFTMRFQKYDRYNVIPGNFDGDGSRDWVFATFRDDTLKAFICWDADTSNIDQLDISEFDKYPGGYASCSYDGKLVYTFKIITATVRSDWLNRDMKDNLYNIYGDTTKLPSTFKHDGFVFASGGDSWKGGFVRYYDNHHWLIFRHDEAEVFATVDTLLRKKWSEENK